MIRSCCALLMVPIFICASLLVGCQNIAAYNVGRHVPTEHIASLRVDGQMQGVFESFEVIIQYDYMRMGDALEISANATLGDHYRALYEHVDWVTVFLHFLDDDNVIISTVLLESSHRLQTEDILPLRKTLLIPAGGVAFSFTSYIPIPENYDFSVFGWRLHR